MYFMVEVLSILEALHGCNIIHADIKPDNFLIRNTPVIDATANSPVEMFASCPMSVKLIDFGRSIDMQLLPEKTTFVEKVCKKECFLKYKSEIRVILCMCRVLEFCVYINFGISLLVI